MQKIDQKSGKQINYCNNNKKSKISEIKGHIQKLTKKSKISEIKGHTKKTYQKEVSEELKIVKGNNYLLNCVGESKFYLCCM